MTEGETMSRKDHLDRYLDTREAAKMETLVDEIRKRVIERALEAESGNVGKAAQRLGLARSSLYFLADKLGVRAWHRTG
jgi:transcriptional regulator of acetoin/glycerol metabolism